MRHQSHFNVCHPERYGAEKRGEALVWPVVQPFNSYALQSVNHTFVII